LQYTRAFGNQNYNVKEALYGVFAQDNWSVLPNLTVNLGLRLDGQTFTGNYGLVSPRFGFAWRLPNQQHGGARRLWHFLLRGANR
jgi:outer membrane receptor protein involved in Fe transport